LAAHHAGLKHIVIPRQNEPDLAEVPERIRSEIAIHLVSNVDEALALTLSAPIEAGTPLGAAPPPA
jgi:ATP-dependent Lon protease